MQSKATTVEEYIAEMPDDRRDAVSKVRQVILDNLPAGYEEAMNWGMITYQIPKDRYPKTYNDQPLMYAALANQKNKMAVYLMAMYSESGVIEQFKKDYKATGKKLDMGKSCVRFKSLGDLPLDLVGEVIASTSVDEYIKIYEKTHHK